jgi:hypothetical protein
MITDVFLSLEKADVELKSEIHLTYILFFLLLSIPCVPVAVHPAHTCGVWTSTLVYLRYTYSTAVEFF